MTSISNPYLSMGSICCC